MDKTSSNAVEDFRNPLSLNIKPDSGMGYVLKTSLTQVLCQVDLIIIDPKYEWSN
jgi:hypothetical protein